MTYRHFISYTQYSIDCGMHLEKRTEILRPKLLTYRGAERILRREWRDGHCGNVTERTLPTVTHMEAYRVD